MKTRVISAIVAAAIVIPIFLLGGWVFQLGVVILASLAYLELLKLKESHKNFPNIVRLLGFLSLVHIVLYKNNLYSVGISYFSITLTFMLLLIPTIFIDKDRYTTKDALYLVGFILFLGGFFNLLISIRNGRLSSINGKWLLLYLVLIAVVTDTFAYVIGSLIGKHKLIPSVSPKKSVEGSVGGSLVGTIICTIFFVNLVSNDKNIVIVVLMTLILTIIGQIGDLFFSKIKRENKIKDFSNIMPGHGGILDRLDSLSFITFSYILIFHVLTLMNLW